MKIQTKEQNMVFDFVLYSGIIGSWCYRCGGIGEGDGTYWFTCFMFAYLNRKPKDRVWRGPG